MYFSNYVTFLHLLEKKEEQTQWKKPITENQITKDVNSLKDRSSNSVKKWMQSPL